MKLIVAKNIGFCFGVRRAVDAALQAAVIEPVYTLGELIHNEDVIRMLAEKGVRAVSLISDIPEGAKVIIRSHGVGEAEYTACTQRKLRVVDATCPFVAKIHDIVRTHYGAGAQIVIIGRRSHPEVIGIRGWCADSALVVENEAEVAELPWIPRACVVTQTTFSRELSQRLCDLIQMRCEECFCFDTICSTTAERQKEAVEISRMCTKMFIIGGRDSSNTQKLCEACKKGCKYTLSIENLRELSLEIIESDDIIGIVAGASTPDWIIMEVVTRMSELEKTMAESPEVEINEVEMEAAATVEEPQVTEPAENADPSFAEAFEKTLVRIHVGQIIAGSVVQIVDGEVSVNIGYKSDGFIPRNEFSSDADLIPEDVVKVGDPIEVEVLKVNDGEGNVLLSRKNIESKKVWDTLMQDEDLENKIFEGIGKEAVKGGLIATIDGVRAFIPASQLSTKYVENIGEFVGQPLSLKVIEVDKQRKRIVASHKAVMLAEAEATKRAKWEALEVGAKVKGVVRRVTDFGAFVDIGGIDGLVHVTDVAWGRVKHPFDVLSIGQEIEVLIRDVDIEKQRISLGYKQLQPKPWTLADEKYPIGSIVEGKVVRIVPFGAFVALEPTIDGLIHISQVGVKRIVKVEDEINVGDTVRCKVLDVNSKAKRISLSRREVILEENPEVAEELQREKDERERAAKERQEQRNAQQQDPQRPQVQHRERSSERSSGEVRERRPRREDADYQLPPVQQSTTSLADLFSGFTASEAEEN